MINIELCCVTLQPTQCLHEGPLGDGGYDGVVVVEVGEQLQGAGVRVAALHRQRALAHRVQTHLRPQVLRDPLRPAHPHHARHRQDQRAVRTRGVVQLPQPRVEVAAHVLEHEAGVGRPQLGRAAQRAGAHHGAGRQLGEAGAGAVRLEDDRVPGVLPLQHRAYHHPRRQGGRQILHGVNHKIHITFLKSHLQLFSEQTFFTNFG